MFMSLTLTTLMLAYPAPRDQAVPDKGPGYLGITFESDEGGVRITEVRPDGPALAAGLRVNDVIRKFNDEPIQFDIFAKKIVRIRPGTIIPLDVIRDGQSLIVKVRLGVRPDDFPYPVPGPENEPDLPVPNDVP